MGDFALAIFKNLKGGTLVYLEKRTSELCKSFSNEDLIKLMQSGMKADDPLRVGAGVEELLENRGLTGQTVLVRFIRRQHGLVLASATTQAISACLRRRLYRAVFPETTPLAVFYVALSEAEADPARQTTEETAVLTAPKPEPDSARANNPAVFSINTDLVQPLILLRVAALTEKPADLPTPDRQNWPKLQKFLAERSLVYQAERYRRGHHASLLVDELAPWNIDVAVALVTHFGFDQPNIYKHAFKSFR